MIKLDSMGGLYSNINYEADQYGTSNISLVHRAMKSMTEVVFFLFNYDVLGIYKEENKQKLGKKGEQYLTADLKIESSRVDLWRKRLRKLSTYWIDYLLVHYSFLCLVQLLIYIVPPQGEQFSHGNWTIKHADEYTSLALRLKYLGELWGSILSDYPGVALVIYSSVTISMAIAMHHLPRYYDKKPMDAVSLRVAFYPKREIRRVDSLIKQLLVARLQAIDRFTAASLAPSRHLDHHHRSFARTPKYSILCSEYHDKTWTYNIEPHKSFRPFNYTENYYLLMWKRARPVTLTFGLLLVVFLIRIQSILVDVSVSIRCKTMNILPCKAYEALTLVDWISFIEIFFQMNITGSLVCLQVIILFMSSMAQLLVAGEVRWELGHFLEELRKFNEKNYMQCTHKYTRPRTVCLDYARISDLLLKLLVKIHIQSRDMKTEARFMTEQTSSVLCILGCVLSINLLTGQLIPPDMQGLRFLMSLSVWLVGNSIAIRCAQVYAEMVKIDGITWSISAQLTFMIDRKLDGSRRKGSTIDFRLAHSIAAWKRLVSGQYLVDQENSVRPFGISLNYRKILEINFSIISLYILSRAR